MNYIYNVNIHCTSNEYSNNKNEICYKSETYENTYLYNNVHFNVHFCVSSYTDKTQKYLTTIVVTFIEKVGCYKRIYS